MGITSVQNYQSRGTGCQIRQQPYPSKRQRTYNGPEYKSYNEIFLGCSVYSHSPQARISLFFLRWYGLSKAAMVSMDCFALTSAINIDENINIGRLDPATRPSSWTALIEPYRVSNSRIQKDTPPVPRFVSFRALSFFSSDPWAIKPSPRSVTPSR